MCKEIKILQPNLPLMKLGRWILLLFFACPGVCEKGECLFVRESAIWADSQLYRGREGLLRVIFKKFWLMRVVISWILSIVFRYKNYPSRLEDLQCLYMPQSLKVPNKLVKPFLIPFTLPTN